MAIPAALRPGGRRFKTFRTVTALMLREMVSTYGRSPGGYIWMILEPIAGIALLSAVFAAFLRTPPLGHNFPYFYASGLLPFTFYNAITAQIAGSIRFSSALLSYPAVTFVDALLARFLLNALTQMLVFVLVMSGIVVAFNLYPLIDWPSIFLGLAMLFSLTLSIGVANSYLQTAFPIWERLWSVTNRPMMILSGVLFLPESVPPGLRDWFMLNPLPHITSQFRKGFFATYEGVYIDPIYVFIFSLVVGMFGLLFLLKNHKDIMLK